METIADKYEIADLWYSPSAESEINLESPTQVSGSVDLDEETTQESKKIGSDIDYLSQQLFRYQDVILNEKWDLVLTIPSRILHVDKDGVYCECVMDSENKIFEEHLFSMDLFEHILPLTVHKSVLIKISTKPGSSKIDVYNGKGIVEESVFNLKDGWEELRDSGLDKPFKI